MQRRNTIQKELVFKAVIELKNHATADEVHGFIKKDYPTLSKGTVYRNLNILVEDGQIRKVSIPGEADRFDHIASEHYHVRCIQCGRVFDVDMDVSNELLNNVTDTHGFVFLSYEVIFSGICPKCNNMCNKKGE